MLSTKIWLEANTERSESNPGRSLGITNNSWRAVWKTVPHDMLTRLCLARHVQNLSRVTCRCDGSVLSRIFIACCRICWRLLGAMIVTDYLLLET